MVDDFWEEKHKANDSYWLTKNSAAVILSLYRTELPVGKTVMDIGIGDGSLIRAISEQNKAVAVDISPTALNRVSSIAQCYLSKDLRLASLIDLAFCTLVLQHCDDQEFVRIINDLQLAKNGVLFAQVATQLSEEYAEHTMEYFRSLKYIRRLIDKTNKKIVSVTTNDDWRWTEKGHLNYELTIIWITLKIQNRV